LIENLAIKAEAIKSEEWAMTTTFENGPGRLFIGGQWREAADGARTDVIDPSTGQVVTTVAEAGAADVDAAVRAAREAFDHGPWATMSGRERGRVLHRVSELIRENADELAALESLDVGKPISLCRPVDVLTAADEYEYCAALAQTLDGATRDTPLNALAYTRRGPLGVVAAITPFNFPLILASSKLAPALAAGNTVVHKPADETPLSALRMAELLHRAGVPDGVVNVVTGAGPVAGEALLRHAGVNKVAFTGSTAVGRHAASVAGEALKPVTMELGGNAAHLGTEVALDVNGLLGGKRIVGLTVGDSETQTMIPALVRMVKEGRLPLHRLISTYPFADIDQAVRDMGAGKAIKPVLTF